MASSSAPSSTGNGEPPDKATQPTTFSTAPPSARLAAPTAPNPFDVSNTQTVNKKTFVLRITFPLNQNTTNDITCIYKAFIASLFLSVRRNGHEISLLTFAGADVPCESPSDVPAGEAISDYFHGQSPMTRNGYSTIKGLSRFSSTIMPHNLKKITSLWTYIQKNKIFFETTKIESSSQKFIGWLRYSHCQFTSRDEALHDLKARIGRSNAQMELQTGNIRSQDGQHSTRVLRIIAAANEAQDLNTLLIQHTMTCPQEYYTSCTRPFQYVPAQREGVLTEKYFIELIRQQNAFLSLISCISVKNIVTMKNSITADNNETTTFLNLATEQTYQIGEEHHPLFISINQGHRGLVRFIVKTANLQNATDWLDNFFDHLNEQQGESQIRSVFGGMGIPVRSNRSMSTALAVEYVKALNLDNVTDEIFSTPPRPQPRRPTVTYGGDFPPLLKGTPNNPINIENEPSDLTTPTTTTYSQATHQQPPPSTSLQRASQPSQPSHPIFSTVFLATPFWNTVENIFIDYSQPNRDSDK